MCIRASAKLCQSMKFIPYVGWFATLSLGLSGVIGWRMI